jgi:hypothetical protein
MKGTVKLVTIGSYPAVESVTVELSQEETLWLKAAMQNPIPGEQGEAIKHRQNLFELIDEAMKHQYFA